MSEIKVQQLNITERSIRQKGVSFSPGHKMPYIQNGTVASIITDADYGFVYRVVCSGSDKESIFDCIPVSRYNSVINQEFTQLTSNSDTGSSGVGISYNFMPGDQVIIAFPNGNTNPSNYGIILGSIQHKRAPKPWTQDLSIAHYSSIMGLEQKITNSGAFSIKFNGPPRNAKEILSKIENKKNSHKKDRIRGGTELRFIEDGSFSVSDNRKNKDGMDISSSFSILKSSSSISLKTSNGTSIFMSGTQGKLSLSSREIVINAIDGLPEKPKDEKGSEKAVDSKITLKADSVAVDGIKDLEIKSPKVAIGDGKEELLSLLTELVDLIGGIIIVTPMGPANPIQAEAGGKWPEIVKIKDKIKKMTGKFK